MQAANVDARHYGNHHGASQRSTGLKRNYRRHKGHAPRLSDGNGTPPVTVRRAW